MAGVQGAMACGILIAKWRAIARPARGGRPGSVAALTRKLAILSCAASALAPLPASACSVTWRVNGKTAEERMAGRTDVRRVIGTYRMERIVAPASFNAPARILGRLETRRGTSFRIVQPYRDEWVDCLAYLLPMADASGTFYLSRRARNGEYELLDWSGRYIPGNATGSGDADPEGQQ